MRRVEPGERGDDFGHDDWLAALGTLSSRCADSLWHGDEAGAERGARSWPPSFAPHAGHRRRTTSSAPSRRRKVEAAADLSIAPLANPPEKRARAAAVDAACATPATRS